MQDFRKVLDAKGLDVQDLDEFFRKFAKWAMGPSVLFLDEQEILDHAMKQDTLCEIAGVRARKWGATSMVTYANALAVPRTDPLAAKDNPQLLQPFVCRCRLASAGLGGRKNRQFSVRHDCGPQETEYFALATTSCFAEKNLWLCYETALLCKGFGYETALYKAVSDQIIFYFLVRNRAI